MTGDDENPDSSANTISINQTGYIHRMLKRFNMQNAVPVKTPLPHSLRLLKATKLDRRCNQLENTEITGSLNHLAVYSRPDIAFAVSTLSQFNSDPTTTHLQAARHVLRYLINTANYSITYGDSDLTIHAVAMQMQIGEEIGTIGNQQLATFSSQTTEQYHGHLTSKLQSHCQPWKQNICRYPTPHAKHLLDYSY